MGLLGELGDDVVAKVLIGERIAEAVNEVKYMFYVIVATYFIWKLTKEWRKKHAYSSVWNFTKR